MRAHCENHHISADQYIRIRRSAAMCYKWLFLLFSNQCVLTTSYVSATMNYYCVVAGLVVFAAYSSADATLGDGLVYAPGHASLDYYAYPKYSFDYAVKDHHTGDDKAQWEVRDGDFVKGAYSLVEPGGSVRLVEYWADDKSGFNAVVKRFGPKLHPAPAPFVPIYKASIPLLGHGEGEHLGYGPVTKLGGYAGAPIVVAPLHDETSSTSTFAKAIAPQRPVVVSDIPLVSSTIQPIIKSAPLLTVSQQPLFKPAPVLAPLPYRNEQHGLTPLAPWNALIKEQMNGGHYGQGIYAQGPLLAPPNSPWSPDGHKNYV